MRETLLPALTRSISWILLGILALLPSCSSLFPHDREHESGFIATVHPTASDAADEGRPIEESRYLPRYSLNSGDSVQVAFAVRSIEPSADYVIDPGDVIEIKVLFHTEVDGTYNVRPDGKISLPYKSDFRIAGLTPQEASDEISTLYSDIFRDPSVSIQLKDSGLRIENLRQVFNFGAQGPTQTYQLGPDGYVNLPVVGEFRAAGLTIAQLENVVNGSYTRMAPEVACTITLTDTSGYGIFVMGEVEEPGRIAITGPTTAARALALAGGHRLAEADLSKCILLSLDVGSGEAIAQYVDLEAVLQRGDISRDAFLGPNDVLVVPSKRIVEMDRWVDQYIAKLLLFRGAGANVSYRLN
ncbi:MAG: polysaccharide biosynthesis/export family protein [Planctomycetes bacterium]|nr:polysaccharide biosynthesis/export family protein [Planctomycetota bacterium]